jgi:ATP-dependent Clp protease protease subunit
MDRLLTLLRNNQGRGRQIEAKADGDEATLYLYDVIGYDFWSDGGIEAKEWVPMIDKIKAKTIHLRIDSPGGSVFDARAIFEALVRHPANVIVRIDGIAASAASLVAMAGNEIEIAEGGFIMIHNAAGCCCGTAQEMLNYAAFLEQVSDSIVTDYARKTGMKKEEIKALMDAESWFNADKSIELGFADRKTSAVKVENRFDLSAFANTPETLKPSAKEETSEDSLSDAAREKRERELALLQRG